MLDNLPPGQLVGLIWDQLGIRIVLPEAPAVFLARAGGLSSAYSDRRRFFRFHFPQKAILEYRGNYDAIYTNNLSRAGLKFIHCEQLFPCEKVRVFLATGLALPLTVRRCQRIQESCYECGAQCDGQASDVMTDPQFQTLLSTHETAVNRQMRNSASETDQIIETANDRNVGETGTLGFPIDRS